MVGKVATVKTCKKVKKQQTKKQFGPTKKVTKIKGKCFLCGEKGFQDRKRLNKNEINLRLGSRVLVCASAVGDVRVILDSSMHLDLIDVYYVPQFKRNLISVSCLNKFGYSVTFNKVFYY